MNPAAQTTFQPARAHRRPAWLRRLRVWGWLALRADWSTWLAQPRVRPLSPQELTQIGHAGQWGGLQWWLSLGCILPWTTFVIDARTPMTLWHWVPMVLPFLAILFIRAGWRNPNDLAAVKRYWLFAGLVFITLSSSEIMSEGPRLPDDLIKATRIERHVTLCAQPAAAASAPVCHESASTEHKRAGWRPQSDIDPQVILLRNHVLWAGILSYLALWFAMEFRYRFLKSKLREHAEQERRLEMVQRLAVAQIQPHFLFNSLASLKHWIDQGDPRAPQMLDSITGYLRAVLPMFQHIRIPLREEWVATQRYLELMQARLGKRLTLCLAEPPEEADALTLPPGVLLTLAENAIEHGITPALRGGWIELASHVEGAQLVVELRNSGSPWLPGSQEGVGLSNTRWRLSQLAGPDSLLSIGPLDQAIQPSDDPDEPLSGCLAKLGLPMTPSDSSNLQRGANPT